MLILKSPLTGVPELPIECRKPVVAVPSPGGEGQGEGEPRCSSGREPALTVILAPEFWPQRLKANKGL